MQLLLIDNRVNDIETVTNSLIDDVDYVIVDFDNDTYDTIISKIPGKQYDSVGIFQENYNLNTYQFINSFQNSTLENVSTEDPNLDTWSQYKTLLSYFKDTLQINTLDLLGCNIHSSLDWNFVIEYLGNHFQITINSSNDNTGSPDFGGNWILESGNVNLVGKYFTNNINNYRFVLGFGSKSSYVITSDNKLYGCGGNGTYSTMDDKDGAIYGVSTNLFRKIVVSKVFILGKFWNSSSASNCSFVIEQDGSLWAAGENEYGQLGNGNTTHQRAFIKVYNPTTNLYVTCIAVSSGWRFSLMVLSDGSLWAAGNNVFGQFGDGSSTSATSTVTIFTKVYNPNTNSGLTCVAVATGYQHSAIILSDGSLWTAGQGSSGALGTGGTPVKILFFTKVYDPTLNNGITCTAVNCGGYSTYILLSDGSLWATGYNSTGTLGIGNTTQQNSFIKVYTPSGDVTCVAVSCGVYHAFMLLSDGSLLAAGLNANGQLGTGNITQQNSFVKVYDPTLNNGITCIAVNCGSYFTYMLLSDGSLWSTGYNDYGQLGNGTTTSSSTFVKRYYPSGDVTCVAVACGTSHVHMLLSDGSLWATGRNGLGQLGNDGGVYYKSTYLGIDAKFVTCYGSATISIIQPDGSLWSKGDNMGGQIGNGTVGAFAYVKIFTKVYTPSNGVTCVAVTANYQRTAMLLSDGSLWATGNNNAGQFGNGTTANTTTFVKVYDPTLLENNNIKCVAMNFGDAHMAMLLSDGSLWTTGLNNNGQLGTGNTTQLFSFTKVYTPAGGLICIAVSCGSFYTAMIKSDGSLWATGLNNNGQLGNGNTTQLNSFTKVYTPSNGVTCKAVSCSQSHTQMLLSDGSVMATGLNDSGQLGIGTKGGKSTIFVNMLKSDETNMSNVITLYDVIEPQQILAPAAPSITSINGVTPTRITQTNPTISISFTQSPVDSTITNYSYSTDGTTYTPLSPAQITSPLIIPATGLISGTSYTITIKAINTSDSSSASNAYPTIVTIVPALPDLITQKATITTITNYGYTLQQMKDGGYAGDEPTNESELSTSLSFFQPSIIKLSNNITFSAPTTITNTSGKTITLTNTGTTPIRLGL